MGIKENRLVGIIVDKVMRVVVYGRETWVKFA